MTRDSDHGPQEPTPRYGGPSTPPPAPPAPSVGSQFVNPAQRYGVPPEAAGQGQPQQGQAPTPPQADPSQRYGNPEAPQGPQPGGAPNWSPQQNPGQQQPQNFGAQPGQTMTQAWGPAPSGQQYAAHPYGQPGGQPGGNRTPWIIGACVIGAVVVLGAGIFGITSAMGGTGSSGDPEEVVTTYLTALSEGDAETALAQGKAPASDAFVTDEILKKQQDIAKISDIKVIGSDTFGDMGRVHVTYKFGEKMADVQYDVENSDDGWKVKDTTVDMDVEYIYGVPEPSVFGEPVGNNSKIYMFPGPVEWGSANEFFTVTNSDPGNFATGTGVAAISSSFPKLDATLTEAGTNAVSGAIQTHINECAASTSARPENCTQYVSASGVKDGSVRWTAPTDLSPLDFTYYGSGDNPSAVSVSGSLKWPVSYETPDGPQTDNRTSMFFGDVDLSADPPVFIPD